MKWRKTKARIRAWVPQISTCTLSPNHTTLLCLRVSLSMSETIDWRCVWPSHAGSAAAWNDFRLFSCEWFGDLLPQIHSKYFPFSFIGPYSSYVHITEFCPPAVNRFSFWSDYCFHICILSVFLLRFHSSCWFTIVKRFFFRTIWPTAGTTALICILNDLAVPGRRTGWAVRYSDRYLTLSSAVTFGVVSKTGFKGMFEL